MKPEPDWYMIGAVCFVSAWVLMGLMLCLTDLIDSIRGKRNDDDDDDKPRRSNEEPVEDDEDNRPVKKACRVKDDE